MKKFQVSSFKWLAVGLVSMAIVGLVAAAQWTYIPVTVPAGISSVTNTTVTSTSGVAFSIPQNVPFTLTVLTSAAQSTNVQPAITGIDFSPDGTNWVLNYVKETNTSSGTTVVVGALQITAAQAAGYQFGRVGSFTSTGATAVNLTGVVGADYY